MCAHISNVFLMPKSQSQPVNKAMLHFDRDCYILDEPYMK